MGGIQCIHRHNGLLMRAFCHHKTGIASTACGLPRLTLVPGAKRCHPATANSPVTFTLGNEQAAQIIFNILTTNNILSTDEVIKPLFYV